MTNHIRNPHTFDMGNYFSGQTYVIGGVDLDAKTPSENQKKDQRPVSYELDWSFLKSKTGAKTPRSKQR